MKRLWQVIINDRKANNHFKLPSISGDLCHETKIKISPDIERKLCTNAFMVNLRTSNSYSNHDRCLPLSFFLSRNGELKTIVDLMWCKCTIEAKENFEKKEYWTSNDNRHIKNNLC